MSTEFVILGIMVLALIVLLLWFVPSQLYKHARKISSVSDEMFELRRLVLDLLSAQELVSRRQQHLVSSLSVLQKDVDIRSSSSGTALDREHIHVLEQRMTELHELVQRQLSTQKQADKLLLTQDSEAWGYLLALLSNMQERLGVLSQEYSPEAYQKNEQLSQALNDELQQLQVLSEEIIGLHQRLQHALGSLERPTVKRRSRITTPLDKPSIYVS